MNTMHSLGQQLGSLADQATQAANIEIDDLIQSGDRDIARIEHQLDHMLGFCFDPAMLQAFKRLCRYYFALNPQATADYVHAYRDMWDAPDELMVRAGG